MKRLKGWLLLDCWRTLWCIWWEGSTWIRFPLPILLTYGPVCPILRPWWVLSSLMPMWASSGLLPFHPSHYFWYICHSLLSSINITSIYIYIYRLHGIYVISFSNFFSVFVFWSGCTWNFKDRWWRPVVVTLSTSNSFVEPDFNQIIEDDVVASITLNLLLGEFICMWFMIWRT